MLLSKQSVLMSGHAFCHYSQLTSLEKSAERLRCSNFSIFVYRGKVSAKTYGPGAELPKIPYKTLQFSEVQLHEVLEFIFEFREIARMLPGALICTQQLKVNDKRKMGLLCFHL